MFHRALQNSLKIKMIRQKTWLLWKTHFPFIMAKSKMNLQSFRLVQGRLLLFDLLLKSQYELLPFGTLCDLG